MKHLTIALAVITLGIACSHPVDKESAKSVWQSLFNGVDLTGWTPKFSGYKAGMDYKHTFMVEDSALRVNYAEYDTFRQEFGHLITDQSFQYYRLRLEYRFSGPVTPGAPDWAIRNNGVMIFCQSAESMNLDQDFPVSVEVQLLGGNGNDVRPTGNLCTPGTNVYMGDTLVTEHCTNSTSRTYPDDQWIHLEVAVMPDGHVWHIVEGDTVMGYRYPVIGGGYLPDNFPMHEGDTLRSGYIALQAESHPTEFRHIMIQPITETPD